MNIHLKYCRECYEAFDIATNYNVCPECRNKKEVEDNGRKE